MTGPSSLKIDDANDPAGGRALLRIRGAAVPADPSFRIRRTNNEDKPNLGPEGWQYAQVVLQPDRVRQDGADLVLEVGPAVTNVLEQDERVEIEIPALGIRTIAFWPYITPALGGYDGTAFIRPASPAAKPPGAGSGRSGTVADPAPGAATGAETDTIGGPGDRAGPEEEPEAADAPDATPDDTAAIPPEDRPRYRPIGIVALLLLLLLAGGAGWYFWPHREPDSPPQPTQAEQQSQPPPVTPPGIVNARQRLDDMLRADPLPPPPEFFALGLELEGLDDPEGALIAMEAAMRGSYGPALAKIGAWYDPGRAAAGNSPFRQPNAEHAARYYRRATAAGHAEAAEALGALCRHLRAAIDRGEADAAATRAAEKACQ